MAIGHLAFKFTFVSSWQIFCKFTLSTQTSQTTESVIHIERQLYNRKICVVKDFSKNLLLVSIYTNALNRSIYRFHPTSAHLFQSYKGLDRQFILSMKNTVYNRTCRVY